MLCRGRCAGVVVLLVAVLLAESAPVSAAIREWSGGVFGSGQFTDPDSWFNGVPTNNTTADVALFHGFLSGPVHTIVNLSAARSVSGLEFGPPLAGGAADNFTFTGSKLTVGNEGVLVRNGAGPSHVINNDVDLALNQLWSLDENLRVNGVVSGVGSWNKYGASTLTLSERNTHAGDLSIYEGTVVLTGAGRLSDQENVDVLTDGTLRMDGMTDAVNSLDGDGAVELLNDARLVVGNSTGDSEGHGFFNGTISGNGALSKRGPGTFILAGDNTYADGTRVEEGTLLIANPTALASATGLGSVVVTEGGTLGGAGAARGSVTIESGGVLSPGGDGGEFLPDKTRSLLTTSLNLQTGATLKIDLGGTSAGATHDALSAVNATIAGTLEISLVDDFTPSPGDFFQIFFATGSLTGTFAGLPQGARVGTYGDTALHMEYATFGSFSIATLVARLLGDFDGNGDVDGRDFLVWQRGGSPTPLSSTDLAEWRAYYGTSVALSATATAVPEPATVGLLIAGVMGAGRRRR